MLVFMNSKIKDNHPICSDDDLMYRAASVLPPAILEKLFEESVTVGEVLLSPLATVPFNYIL